MTGSDCVYTEWLVCSDVGAIWRRTALSMKDVSEFVNVYPANGWRTLRVWFSTRGCVHLVTTTNSDTTQVHNIAAK